MKVKTKLCATALAVALGVGLLAGCQLPGSGSKSGNPGGDSTSQPEENKYLVNVPSGDYTVAGINAEGYAAGAKVSFTVTPASGKELVSVGYDTVDITPKADGSYEFNMPEKNVTLIVTVRAVAQYSLSYTGTLQVDGDPVTFSLKLGTDPVPGFTLEEAAGADKVDISGAQVTAKEAGETVIIAKVNGEEKARLTVTVTATEIMTVKAALDAAITEAPFNNKNGKDAAMSSPKTISGKVLAVGSYNNGAVQAIVDDGTAAVVIQIAKASETVADPVAIGDAIKVTTVFTNYYGLLEGISKGAKTGGNANNIAAADVVKIDKTFTPKLSSPENLTAAQYDSYYTTCATNGNKDATNRTWSEIKLANLNVTFDKVDENDKGAVLYTIDGSTKSIDIKSSHDQGASFDQVKGHKSKLTGFLLGVNSSKNKSNMIAMAQTPLAVESITFKDGDSKTIFLNNPVELEYTTAPEGSYGQATWASSNPAKVKVENGVITGLEQGSSTITVTINGVSKSIEVTVSGEQHVCENLALNKESLSLVRGASETLTATVTPSNCTDAVVWSSSDSTVASVDQNGKVTAVANGNANITVTCGTFSKTCAVEVRDQKISDLAHAKAGDAVDLYGYVAGKYPADNVFGMWIADGDAGICVNIKPTAEMTVGKIVHVVGEVQVSRYYSNGNAVYTGAKEIGPAETDGVTVVQSHEGLVAPTTYALNEAAVAGLNEADFGKKATVTGVVTAHSGSGNNNHTITLSVGAESFKVYAQKSSMGDVSDFDRAAVGTTATFTGFISAYKSAKVDFDFSTLAKGDFQLVNPTIDDVVVPAIKGIKLDRTTANVEQGKTLQLTCSADPTGAQLPGAVTWAVSGNSKVTVNNTGLVSVAADASTEETATVTATCGEYTATCVITVKVATVGTTLKLENIGAGISSTAVTQDTETTVNNFTLVYNNGKKQGNAIFLTSGTGYIYNKTAVAGAIKSIKVTTNSGAAAACNYAVAFSATAITGKVVGTNGYVIGAGASHDYECTVDNAQYFCISVSAKNGQVLNIEILYE